MAAKYLHSSSQRSGCSEKPAFYSQRQNQATKIKLSVWRENKSGRDDIWTGKQPVSHDCLTQAPVSCSNPSLVSGDMSKNARQLAHKCWTPHCWRLRHWQKEEREVWKEGWGKVLPCLRGIRTRRQAFRPLLLPARPLARLTRLVTSQVLFARLSCSCFLSQNVWLLQPL